MYHKYPYDLLVILGPTASGKTKLATLIAQRLDGEIISADSRQVYREMDVGTGKDYSDYQVDGTKIPFHLIDIAQPGDKYNVYEYQKDFINVYQKLIERNKLPVLCGGSGMYLDAILNGYRLINVPLNEELRKDLESRPMNELSTMLSSMTNLHNTTDTSSRKRLIRAIEIAVYYQKHPSENGIFPKIHSFVAGVKYERDKRRSMITARLKRRLHDGMIDEAEQLLAKGLSPKDMEWYGLEYKFLSWYLTGKISYEEMFTRLNTAIHQFAKRQMTWFRKMEREGISIHWIDGEIPLEEKASKIITLFKREDQAGTL
ncbi:MAG: tRNA (adenosine(37)-N6)-dimethylallyltransferase MiaA [Bacteroidales bacterium]